MKETSARPIVDTTLGSVQGVREALGGTCRFLGIPYAAPPVGARRFRAPQPADAWVAPRDASRFGPASAQCFDPHEAPLHEYYDGPPPADVPLWVGSEDCLTLNVWTRLGAGAKRPVLVWIHGGANWLEGSRLSAYSGAPLSAYGDLVVVSVNYRLGIFGFLDVSVLGGPEYAGTHSLGLRDQLAAIDWVSANAEAFGGDPSNITLMGESAGSMDISWLLTTGRLPRGVRRVFLMSGVAWIRGSSTNGSQSLYSEEEGQHQAEELLRVLGITSMDQLLSASTGTLLESMARAIPSRDMLFFWDNRFYPRIDGSFIPCNPFDFVASGGCRDREIVLGSTAYEMGLWTLWDPQFDQRPAHEMAARLPGLPPALAADLAATYERITEPGIGAGMQLLADAMFVMPAVRLAEAQAAAGGRAWLYEFAWEVDDPRLRATHAADVGFFLGTHESSGVQALIGKPRDAAAREARSQLAENLQTLVTQFATRGNPGPATTVEGPISWPIYNGATRAVMRLDTASRVVHDPYSARREWWETHAYGRGQPRPTPQPAPSSR